MSAATQHTTTPRGMEGRFGAARAWAPSSARVAGEMGRRRPFWASAAPSVVGSRFPIIAESLAAALGMRRGQRVLDLGAGSGHVALSAGRRGCQVASVVSSDPIPYAQALLARDAQSVASERLAVDFWRWDIASVPFSDADFDVVASSFAAMFEPDQEGMADEMLRLCRPGGRVGITAWTPESFIGRLFETVGAYLPGDVASPFLWGTPSRVAELFGSEAKAIDITPRRFMFRYSSPRQGLDIWKSTYEPLRLALEMLNPRLREDLDRDLMTLVRRSNVARDGGVTLRGDYFEVVVQKRGAPNESYSH